MGLLMYQTMVVLTCLTKGRRPSCTFDIEVDTNVKVNRFKELIRDDQKHTFAKFDTSQLILRKINIPNNRANEINDLDLENDPNIEEMFGSEEIRKYFENVPNESIHILVEPISYESDKKVEELGDDLQKLTIDKHPRADNGDELKQTCEWGIIKKDDWLRIYKNYGKKFVDRECKVADIIDGKLTVTLVIDNKEKKKNGIISLRELEDWILNEIPDKVTNSKSNHASENLIVKRDGIHLGPVSILKAMYKLNNRSSHPH